VHKALVVLELFHGIPVFESDFDIGQATVLFTQIINIAIYGISDNLANPVLGSGARSGDGYSSALSVTKGSGFVINLD
jgi:hypothetical protein